MGDVPTQFLNFLFSTIYSYCFYSVYVQFVYTQAYMHKHTVRKGEREREPHTYIHTYAHIEKVTHAGVKEIKELEEESARKKIIRIYSLHILCCDSVMAVTICTSRAFLRLIRARAATAHNLASASA